MLGAPHHRILKDEEALTPQYLPARLIGREAAVEEIAACLAPAIEGRKPMHVWVYGPSGTGKTTAARLAVEWVRGRSPIRTAGVSGWRHRTFYSVLDTLTETLRVLRCEEQRTSVRLQRLENHLGQEPCIVILDDLDLSARREREDMIYSLAGIGNVGLICISISDRALLELDRRVRARLNPKVIVLKPYSPADLLRILEDRAKAALVPGAWNRRMLARIAQLAGGSASLGLEILRSAAAAAEAAGHVRITGPMLRAAKSQCLAAHDQDLAATLTPHHEALWRLVRRARTIPSDRLRRTYLAQCRASRIQPVAPRTYTKYLSILVGAGLIQTVGRDRGARVFTPGTRPGPQPS